VIITWFCFNNQYTPNSFGCNTTAFSRFLADKYKLKSSCVAKSFTTNNCLLVAFKADTKFTIVFVLGASNVASNTKISPLATLADKADFKAKLLTFLFTFC
jgi:hypothetical protein